MKIKILTIAFALLIGAGSANAEDSYYYQGNGTDNGNGYDNGYKIPPSYQGQYYPEEYEGATGYHGTKKTSQNSNDIEDGYYNYYY